MLSRAKMILMNDFIIENQPYHRDLKEIIFRSLLHKEKWLDKPIK